MSGLQSFPGDVIIGDSSDDKLVIYSQTELKGPIINSVQVVSDYAKLRGITPSLTRNIRIVSGSGGIDGDFYAVTGAAPGTYVDNGGTIIVHTGGDGSAAWLRNYSGAVNVKWFDSGIANAAFSSAIDVLISIGGGDLLVPPGVYTWSAAVNKTLPNGITVRVIGYGATIDATGITGTVAGDTNIFSISGSRSTGSLLSASPLKGDFSFTTSSSINSVAGEVVLITSTDLWNSTRAYYYKGELAEIASVVSTTYSISNPLFDGYTAATTTAYRLAMPTVIIEGLELKANSNQIGISLQYCRNPQVIKCKIHGARYAGAQFYYCYGGIIDGNEIYDSWYSGTGTSYGVSINSSQGVIVSGNVISQARHCISSGGQEPCRNITYVNNPSLKVHPSQADTLAIDMHGNTELSSIINNVCEGISISSINTSIIGNTITGNIANKTGLNIFQEINSDYYKIVDNVIVGSASGEEGIWVSPNVASISIGTLEIRGNNVSTKSYAIRFQPRSSGITGCTITSLIVHSNLLRSDTTPAFLINTSGAAAYSITDLDSRDNVYRSINYDSFSIISGTSVTRVHSLGDKFFGNRISGYIAQFAGTDVTVINPHYEGNTGGAGNSRSVRFTNTGIATHNGATTNNLTVGVELDTGGPATYIEHDRKGTTTAILNTASSKIIGWYGLYGKAVTYGTGIPAAGTWVAGDRIYNTTPGPGLPAYWECTVAGTPGTWVPVSHIQTAVTVAALPAAGTAGATSRMFVTDANATTLASVVVGGGANYVPVYSDGTNWRIG